MQRECPSKRTYIATADGYVSTSDTESDDTAVANHAGTTDAHDTTDEEILGTQATANYRTIIVQRALSAQVNHVDAVQRHNLFHTFFVVNDCRVLTIIDSGSCNNLVSSEMVDKLGLAVKAHPHPYHIQWVNNTGKVKVTHTARVHFSIGSYHDSTDFDVMPMDACSLILGRPWEFDTDASHHGRTNTYSLIHKGKKISLVPMSPTELLEYEKDKAHNCKKKDEVPSENYQPIVLKQPSFLAKKYDLAEIDHCRDASCYVLMCTQALCSFDGTPIALFHDNNLPHVDLISTYHKLCMALVTPFVFTASHITFMRLMIDFSCAVISNIGLS